MVRVRSQQDLKQELVFKVEAPTPVIIGTFGTNYFCSYLSLFLFFSKYKKILNVHPSEIMNFQICKISFGFRRNCDRLI